MNNPEREIPQELLESKKEQLKKEGSFIEKRGKELNNIREVVGLPDEGRLYYPACGGDISPSIAFEDWDITYLDSLLNVYENEFSELPSESTHLVRGDLTKPPFGEAQSFDVVLIVSPGAHLESSQVVEPSTKNLKENGALICDNYHGTRDYVAENMKETFEEIPLENNEEFSVFRKK